MLKQINQNYHLGVSLAHHAQTIFDFDVRGYEEELANVPRKADGTINKSCLPKATPSCGISAEDMSAARQCEARLRQIAQLAGQLSRDGLEADSVEEASRVALRDLKRAVGSHAVETWKPSVLEPHGHGRDLKSQHIRDERANGARVERIRDDETREIGDNYSHAQDYSALRDAREEDLLRAVIDAE